MPNDYEQTLAELETALHVRHIAHRPLTTIDAATPPSEAERIGVGKTLNNLPVVGSNGEIIGVLENVNGEVRGVNRPRGDVQTVRFSMRPLSDRMLVESNRSLEGLLEDLLHAPYYQLDVTQGRIDGIVTASDLNKAPVRVWAYATVARLETAMAAAIRNATGEDDDVAVSKLGDGGAGQVRGAHKDLLAGALNADLLDATTFKQKGVILARLGVGGSENAEVIEREFEHLYRQLRNPLMHMSPFVAESIEGLRVFAGDLARARTRTREALGSIR
jgi:CBS domain-containing protein